jgi:hypothetical protein
MHGVTCDHLILGFGRQFFNNAPMGVHLGPIVGWPRVDDAQSRLARYEARPMAANCAKLPGMLRRKD